MDEFLRGELCGGVSQHRVSTQKDNVRMGSGDELVHIFPCFSMPKEKEVNGEEG